MYRVGKEEVKAVERIIKSKQYFRMADGKSGCFQECDKFEKEWSKFTGSKHSLLMSGGGTAGLICALAGLEIGPGDEVIVPAYTFMASASAVLCVGAIPVIAEVDDSLMLDPVDVEKKISKRTKAIMPVHLLGLTCDMGKLMALANKYKLFVVEDACQASGVTYNGIKVGKIGHAGAYSFNYFKTITCGEGGAVVTDSKKVFERALVYHDSGANFRPFAKKLSIPVFLGMQFRASEIMGAMLRVQLKRLPGILKDLRKIKNRISGELASAQNIYFVRSNDGQGEAGAGLHFQFENEKIARKFASAPGVAGTLPIDSGKHVYSNWGPILEHRIGVTRATNPYFFAANKGLNMKYSKTMCPKTLDILRRSVRVGVNPEWKEKDIENKIRVIRKAGESL